MKYRKQKTFFKKLFALTCFFIVTPSFVSAQDFSGFNFGLNRPAQVSLTTNPTYPGPFEEVTVKVNSPLLNTQIATVSWNINGEPKTQGRNQDTYTFQTGAIGEKTTIQVLIETRERNASKTIVVTPGMVDVLWETDTYTPPFYKGKALPTSQSEIHLTAIPQTGESVSPAALTYEWQEDFSKNFDLSGYGKRQATLSGNYAGNKKIRVIASNNSGLKAAGETEVPLVDPQIVFYPETENLGPRYNLALTSGYNTSGSDLEVIAEPYFFSFSDRSNNPGDYRWRLNNETIDITGPKEAVLLQFPEEEGGRARLDLEIHNTEYLLQRANNSIVLNF